MENFPAVVAVNSQIKVEPPFPEHSDQWIALKIRGRLLVKGNVSATSVQVTEVEKMMSASVSEHTEDAISAWRSRFDAAQERLTELYSSARTKVAAGAKYTDETIRANPYQSLGIAAGIGVLVGRRRE